MPDDDDVLSVRVRVRVCTSANREEDDSRDPRDERAPDRTRRYLSQSTRLMSDTATRWSSTTDVLLNQS